jgi:hypothetical protein
MMKNTLTLNVDQLVANYRTTMLEQLNVTQDEIYPEEFGGDLIAFGTTLRGLASLSNMTALNAFRREFEDGFTMMMLEDSDFQQLEEWEKNGEDYQVVLFREDGSALGVIGKEGLTW